jgi:hypothetical protein
MLKRERRPVMVSMPQKRRSKSKGGISLDELRAAHALSGAPYGCAPPVAGRPQSAALASASLTNETSSGARYRSNAPHD